MGEPTKSAEQQPPPPYNTASPEYPQQHAAYPQQVYSQSNQSHTSTVVVTQPVVTNLISGQIIYRDVPIQQQCPSCHQHIVTRMDYEFGLLVWLIAGLICIVGGWLGCCLIPFCIPALQDVTHHCPNCTTYLGRYDRVN
ncbi:LITAF domain-containing protein-like [Saccoglossus kowalevskii]|uniref:Lipopolysaccharide-induced tumor necrosis factor-alpha factor homolog n=1 Tax=Saccoglossus kowalevskii TaxID=10224 RepID=A0ABM0MRL0_SACKO|nr:PREDICTED: lipopolysaccharide-induced tumor necrosis factor-alpha factor homolog [Saccoglossus kowalevskii]